MQVLIAGGAGYIGSTIASACSDSGITPVILDSLVTGRREFAADYPFYEGDIADGPLIDRVFAEHPEISAAIAQLTSSSTDELHKLISELQKMQEFLKSEVDNVQRQIDSAVAGINIIVETIGPWKSIAGSFGTRNVRAGGPAANIEQRIRGG